MSANPTVWAFDLGKASIGEAVRNTITNEFPHIASLLIPPELARRGPATTSGTPASRYRAMKTRQAHHERERWLETVWRAAGLTPLQPREVWENPETGKWELKHKADYRLEREFAPKQFESKDGQQVKVEYPDRKAGDGASAATPEDFEICYTSCLLRIKLLQWKEGDPKLAEWQIYKALRSALQRRGYGRVPWAAKEAIKKGSTPEELEREQEKKLQRADPRYREAVDRWSEFKRFVSLEFHFPCYYDAFHMGLWNPVEPDKLLPRSDHRAGSTRNVRFDRADVEREIKQLAQQADRLLTGKLDQARRLTIEEFKADRLRRILAINERRQAKNAILPPEEHKRLLSEPSFERLAKSAGEFLCHGPAGQPDESSFDAYRKQRREAGVRQGTFEEWMAALGQKTPRFDNRILNPCVLIPRYHVCKVDVRLETDDEGKPSGRLIPESLLASEVTLLLKLKNLLMADAEKGQRKLRVEEVREIFAHARRQLEALRFVDSKGELVKNWPSKVADCFSITKSEWGQKKTLGKLGLRPMPGHEEVKAPKTSGRSAYSRVALRILKELILSGEAPTAFHERLVRRDAELLRRLGPSPEKPLTIFNDSTAADEKQRKQENTENRKRGLLVSELNFLNQMRKDNAVEDSWENIFIPSQTLDALQQHHTEDGKLDADAAIRELLGTIKDPIVRHRLEVFNQRLKKLQFGDQKEGLPGFGVPEAIVLEFVREDFMGEETLKKYQRFLNERSEERKAAKAEAAKLGLGSRSSGLRYELFKAQGGICLYTGKPLSETKLDDYEIDHIVPRSLGGPDAAVNYVLTFHDVNHTKEKGKLTPFALLHGTDGWDAYVQRIKARATTLRNKKVQLLTRQDAPELVERYTALAETAWVSKLAQTIVNLHFGWTNGTDYSGPQPVKRVIVVSGGLTARVRRKYGLDKLLYTDVTDPDVLAKKVKNRDDQRHHALDAMVLTFIPQWARDRNKEGFFRFPEGVNRDFLHPYIEQVMPRNVAYERPALADTSFGRRHDGDKRIIVQRVRIFDLGQKPAGAPGQTTFDLRYLLKQSQSVRDPIIRCRLEEFATTKPDAASWKQFCDSFAQRKRDGTAGARIVKVWVNAAETDEFKDLSKDGKGAWRKGKGDHQGQIIYTDADGSLAVMPVYAHASVRQELSRIAEIGGKSKVHCYVRSKCLIRLRKGLPHSDYKLVVKNEQKQKRRIPATAPLPAGTFMLSTIITASMDVEFTTANGQRFVAPLRVLIDSGFETA